MRLTIIIPDRTIIIDGEALTEINQDFTWIPENVRAVQWYHTHGEIEFNDGTLNEKIEELGIYAQAIQIFSDEKERLVLEEQLKYQKQQESRDTLFELRMYRNGKLFESDWTQMVDSPISETKKQEWRIYRQQLRDLPNSNIDSRELMDNIGGPLWPVKPD